MEAGSIGRVSSRIETVVRVEGNRKTGGLALEYMLGVLGELRCGQDACSSFVVEGETHQQPLLRRSVGCRAEAASERRPKDLGTSTLRLPRSKIGGFACYVSSEGCASICRRI